MALSHSSASSPSSASTLLAHTNGHVDSSSPATSSTNTARPAILASLQRFGYAIVPSLLSPSALNRLREAASRTAALARGGRWPHVRTVPKQFPPWPTPDLQTGELPPDSQGIWGVQHLLHPELEDADVFAACYFGRGVLGVVKELLELKEGEQVEDGSDIAGVNVKGEERNGQCENRGDDRLVMELFNMLVGTEVDFQLRWHRDAVGFDMSRDEEAIALGVEETKHGKTKRRPYHAQYNIPLYEDSSLELVPGSHLRPRTEEEVRILSKDPWASELPGMIAVHLKPGDVVFYDNNVIHRGVYKAGVERMTLHGSVGDSAGGTGRARNVLQHAVGDWVEKCDFFGLKELDAMDRELNDHTDAAADEQIRKRAESMRKKLVKLGRDAGDQGEGYVFDD